MKYSENRNGQNEDKIGKNYFDNLLNIFIINSIIHDFLGCLNLAYISNLKV